MIETRTYGTTGPWVIALHGGPGAPGYMAPVARNLAGRVRVLEPLQRGRGSAPLTVARHVKDLYEVIEHHCSTARPALLGSSWGAMLALAYAAEHPASAGPLVLVGCGTFDTAARRQFQTTVESRMDADLRNRLDQLPREIADPDERLRAVADLMLPLYSCDPVTTELGVTSVDAEAHAQTWADMLRLQRVGVYPQAFAGIKSSVLMLHGTEDPHPGPLIRASLLPYLPQIEYHEWTACGHYPWLERETGDEFYRFTIEWLAQKLASDSDCAAETPPGR